MNFSTPVHPSQAKPFKFHSSDQQHNKYLVRTTSAMPVDRRPKREAPASGGSDREGRQKRRRLQKKSARPSVPIRKDSLGWDRIIFFSLVLPLRRPPRSGRGRFLCWRRCRFVGVITVAVDEYQSYRNSLTNSRLPFAHAHTHALYHFAQHSTHVLHRESPICKQHAGSLASRSRRFSPPE